MREKIGKFKIGDLVRLSAYGLRTDQNEGVCAEDIGMVIRLDMVNHRYPIAVQWIGEGKQLNRATQFFFRELKLVKK
tara:strand:- start:3519 stop:3749 length:231 start_codon:yes stop_codon:yes gene_type:complete